MTWPTDLPAQLEAAARSASRLIQEAQIWREKYERCHAKLKIVGEARDQLERDSVDWERAGIGLIYACADCWAQFAVTGEDGTRSDGAIAALAEIRRILESCGAIDSWGRLAGEPNFGQPPTQRERDDHA